MCTLQRKFYLAKMNPVVILLVEYLVMQIFTYPDKTASKLCIHFRKMHLKLYPFYSKFHFKAYSHYDYFKTNQGLAKCKKGHFSCCRSSLTFWCGLQQAGSSERGVLVVRLWQKSKQNLPPKSHIYIFWI